MFARGCSFRFAMLAFAGALLLPSIGRAQKKTNEFGIDATFAYLDREAAVNATTLGVPVGQFRWANFVTDAWAVETIVGFELFRVAEVTTSDFEGQLNLQYHLVQDPNKVRPFFGFGGGFDVMDFGAITLTQWSAGARFGVKISVAEAFGVRLQALYSRGFEDDDVPAVNRVEGSIGMSFFLYPKSGPRASDDEAL